MTYQLYYNEATKAKCHPETLHIDTSGTITPLFEAYWMLNLPIPEDGFMAVISPEFERKTRRPITTIHQQLKRVNCDIMIPRNAIRSTTNQWYAAERWHHGFVARSAVALARAGLFDYILKPGYLLYSNFFWMRVEHWHQYRKELERLVSAMDEFKMFTDNCPHQTSSGHTKEQLMKATGFNHYTWYPFICERLIGSFMADKKLKIGYL